jgi:hypothetical protein
MGNLKFKVKILNIDSVLKKIENLVTNDLYDSSLLQDIQDFSILRIQAETRKGKSLPYDANQQPLANSTVNIRTQISKGKIKPDNPDWFKPDPTFFKPKKSNLTSTGQMLESLKGSITKSDGTIVVKPTGSRDPSLSNSKEFTTNISLAKDLALRGRKFLGLDALSVKRIRKMVLDEIRRLKKKRNL